MSNSRAKEIERQRAEALEGLKRAIQDDFNAVQDAHWFHWGECYDHVECWVDVNLTSDLIRAMANGTPQQQQEARESLQKDIDDLVEEYALEEGECAINRTYNNLLEDLANG